MKRNKRRKTGIGANTDFVIDNDKPKLTGIQKMLIAGISGASIVVAGASIYRSLPIATNQSHLEQRTEISFEEATRDETLRQIYTGQKSALLSREFERTFNTRILSQTFYDPDYRQLDELCEAGLEKYGADPIKADYFRNSIRKSQENRESDNEKCLGVTILPTANFAGGEPSEIYLSRECFDPRLVASDDEFLSILDHELFHAACNNKGIPIKHDASLKYDLDNSLDTTTSLNCDLGNECLEVVAFHYQLQNIEQGLRTVRSNFRQRLINAYSDSYQTVKFFADRNDGSINSRFCAALIDSLTYLPGPRK